MKIHLVNRFLRLLSEHDWMFTPMIVDINEDMTPDDEKEINVSDPLNAKQLFIDWLIVGEYIS